MREHHRADGELLGWTTDAGEAVDRLGRSTSGLDDPAGFLDALGLGYLAGRFEVRHDGGWMAVRLLEVSTDRVVVTRENHGAIGAPRQDVVLPFPPGAALRERQ
jgi:hypothetical protein